VHGARNFSNFVVVHISTLLQKRFVVSITISLIFQVSSNEEEFAQFGQATILGGGGGQ
jgi:hypothetical protein